VVPITAVVLGVVIAVLLLAVDDFVDVVLDVVGLLVHIKQ